MKLIVLAVCIVQSLSLDENLLPKYLDYEQSFIRDLEEYIEIQESVLQLLRKKLLNFQVEHAAAKSVRYFDSEINKFLILKRLTIDTKLMVAKSTRVAEDFQRNVHSITKQSDFPSQEQLSTAANAIANLQRRDKVKAERLASGIYKRVKSRWISNNEFFTYITAMHCVSICLRYYFRNSLSSVDCFWIGKHLNKRAVFSLAVEWLTESMKRYDDYYDQHQLDEVEILEELAKSFIGNNQIYDAERVIEKILRMNSKSQVHKLLKMSKDESDSRSNATAKSLLRLEGSCLPRHFLLHNIFECSI